MLYRLGFGFCPTRRTLEASQVLREHASDGSIFKSCSTRACCLHALWTSIGRLPVVEVQMERTRILSATAFGSRIHPLFGEQVFADEYF